MPTPFMHLDIAERIQGSGRLRSDVRDRIARALPAFYFGSVAADYQTLCDIPRAETHFYALPPDDAERAYPRMLAQFPQLASSKGLPNEQAVFVAAYCAHLLLDLDWYREVLVPYFLRDVTWQGSQQGFLVHNTLLTYLDKQAADVLPGTAAKTLAAAEPAGWLPFARDEDLIHWRNYLVRQMGPDARPLTVDIYAERMSMLPGEFAANLESETWMSRHLFDRLPVNKILATLAAGVEKSVDLISDYLDPGPD